jgi:hypothetical protein
MVDPGSVVLSWRTAADTAGSSREIIAVKVGTTVVVSPERPLETTLPIAALSIPERENKGPLLTA